MNEQDVYYTIESGHRAEIKIKGSRFIATAVHVSSKEQALEALEQIRKEFFDATHNCFAYRLGEKGLDFRAADDGEPNGTAGKPILFAIQKYGVSDTLVVVTRYFGGTKLGTGGLARAYTNAAELVLESCQRSPVYKASTVRVFCTYDDVKTVLKLLEKYAIEHEGDYRDAIEFHALIPLSQTESFIADINSMTNGRAGCIVES